MFFQSRRQHSLTKVTLGKLNDQEYFLQLPERKGLVLSGGGAKCIAYAGMVHSMAQNGQLAAITHIAGTSAGAIIGSFIAFGISPDHLSKIMIKTNHNLLRYEPAIRFPNPVSNDRTRAFFEMIFQIQLALILPEKEKIPETYHAMWDSLKLKVETFKSYFSPQPFNLESFDDLLAFEREQYLIVDSIFRNFEDKDFISFQDLDHLRQIMSFQEKNMIKDLNVAVADRTIKETKVYSLRKTPQVSVSLAIQMSGAHPLLYQSFMIDEHELSDGGFYDNMPVSLLYQIEGVHFNREDIVCVRADCNEDFGERFHKSLLAAPEKVETLAANLWDWITGAESMTARSINQEKQFSFGNMLYLNTSEVSTTSVDITEEERRQVIHSAFIQTTEFFNRSRLIFSNPVLTLFRLPEQSLNSLAREPAFPELKVYLEHVILIKRLQERIIHDLMASEWQFIVKYINEIVYNINQIKDIQRQNPAFQHLSRYEDDSILNLVLEQINHSSEGRYTEYLEYKEHEYDNLFSYLLWVILYFLKSKFGLFSSDERYCSPLLERLYVVEHTKNLLLPS